MTRRRAVHAALVGAIATATLLVFVAPVGATGSTFYLKATGVPISALSTIPPVVGSLPNYDPWRDDDPGILLAKTDGGWEETDPTKFQQWVAPVGLSAIDATFTLEFWAAMKDFDDEKEGKVNAYLLECDADGTDCCLLASGATKRSSSESWARRVIDFGHISHDIPFDRSLVVKLTVDDDSADDMLLAYDAEAYPSALTVEGTTTTTTTSTIPQTTTTSTVPPTTTTSTTVPPTTTTSTLPPITTTSTTVPPTSTTSTTTTTSTTVPPTATSTSTTTTSTVPPTTTTTVPPTTTTTVPPPTGVQGPPIGGDPANSKSGLTVQNAMPTFAGSSVGASSGGNDRSPLEDLAAAFTLTAENLPSIGLTTVALGMLIAVLALRGISQRERDGSEQSASP